MDFLKQLGELDRVGRSDRTAKVSFGEEFGVLVGYRMQSNRHLADTVIKVSGLSSLLQGETAFLKLLSSFYCDRMYYFLYEWAERIEEHCTVEAAVKGYRAAVKGLVKMHRAGVWHGGLTDANI